MTAASSVWMRCPSCTEPIPFDAPAGVCPWCQYDDAQTSPDVPALSLLPNSMGGYPIRGLLGEGAFGVVYLAYSAALGRDVALKVSKQRVAGSDELDRFRREIELLAQLDLPNVVRILDWGMDEGRLYFSMPVMGGGTLRSRMSSALDPASAARLMACIARAVHALHTHPLQVLHRDLKPENILFDRQGTPYISDFGIANAASPGGWVPSDASMGCPAYVAPEQALLDQGEPTPASDVYSLGAIFYELLTGAPPHAGKTADEVLRHIALSEPMPPRRLVPSLPLDLETVCLHALERANVRYASAAEFADDLERAVLGRPILARRSSPLRRTLRWARRHPAHAGALVLMMLLGLAAFAHMRSFALSHSEPNHDRILGRNTARPSGPSRLPSDDAVTTPHTFPHL